LDTEAGRGAASGDAPRGATLSDAPRGAMAVIRLPLAGKPRRAAAQTEQQTPAKPGAPKTEAGDLTDG
ncbi:hypothetical protein, partial [uncultured Albimonas sp.]|uniref:hypothetical protein n=1 Tax=uncultured Albimonas sp. TaxID=1331701 RepID=UPI0030ECFDDD